VTTGFVSELQKSNLLHLLQALATGDTYQPSGHSFHVSFTTAAQTVNEMCMKQFGKNCSLHTSEPTMEIWKAA